MNASGKLKSTGGHRGALGATAEMGEQVGQLCAGAIAMALDGAFGGTIDNFEAFDDSLSQISDVDAAEAALALPTAECHGGCANDGAEGSDYEDFEDDQVDEGGLPAPPALPLESDKGVEDEAQVNEEDAPRSPSMMSVGSPRPGSPRADSPSLLMLDEGPCWTTHKTLGQQPEDPASPPPKSARSAGKRQHVLLGVPAPLTARGRERCTSKEPLSARYHRPSGCVTARGPSPRRGGNVGGA